MTVQFSDQFQQKEETTSNTFSFKKLFALDLRHRQFEECVKQFNYKDLGTLDWHILLHKDMKQKIQKLEYQHGNSLFICNVARVLLS